MSALQDLVDALATQLGRAVAIDDQRFGLIVFSAHAGDVDDVRLESILHRHAPDQVMRWLRDFGVTRATAPLRIPAHERLGMRARWCVPIRFDGVLLGYLWLVDEPVPLSADDVALADRSTAQLAPLLYRDRLRAATERAQERDAVAALVAGDASPREAAARSVLSDRRLAAGARYVAVVIGAACDRDAAPEDTAAALAAAERVRRGLAPHRCLAGDDGRRGVALAVLDHRTTAIAELDRVVGNLLADRPQSAARGPAVDDLRELHRSYAGACDALAVAPALPEERRMTPIAWDRLGAWRLLARVPADGEHAAPIPHALRILEARADGPQLLDTLTCYLDHGGDIRRTAGRLFIHRTSLYARLRRIERETGVDLADGDQRLELHMGLRMLALLRARVTGCWPSTSWR